MIALIYLAIGALLLYCILNHEASKDEMASQYIKYRCQQIVKGKSYYNEKSFRAILTTVLFIMVIIGWPILIIQALVKSFIK